MASVKSQIEVIDFSSLQNWQAIARPALYWLSSATAMVLLLKLVESHHNANYDFLDLALAEAVGPNLWNLVGTFGLVTLGLNVIFPMSNQISHATGNILTTVYIAGATMTGIWIGQFLILLPELALHLSDWRTYFYVPLITVLLAYLGVINFGIGCLAHLSDQGNGFLPSLRRVSLAVRLPVGTILICLPSYLLWLETVAA